MDVVGVQAAGQECLSSDCLKFSELFQLVFPVYDLAIDRFLPR
jgi:hypothetical protein